MSPDLCEVRCVDEPKVRSVRRAMKPPEAVSALAETFRVLGDPTRLRIAFALSREELCVCDLAAVCDLSESATSQHLRVLRSLRIVKPRRDGRMSYYSIDDDHVRVLLGVCLNHLHDRDALEGIA